MGRGRPKQTPVEEQLTKFSRVYEDDFTIRTWRYDLDITDRGPVEVSITYKPGAEQAQKQIAKEAKEAKRIRNQMKKIKAKEDANKKPRGRKKKIK